MEKKLSIKDLTNTEWHYVHRRSRSPFYTFLLFNGLARHDSKEIKFPYEIKKSAYVDKELLLSATQWRKLQMESVKEMKKDSSFFLKLIDKAYDFDRQVVDYINKSFIPNCEKLSNQALADKLERYQDLSFKSAVSVFMIAPMALEKYLEESVALEISKKMPAEKEKLIQEVSLPSKQTSAAAAEINLLKLAVKRKNGLNIDKQIKKHVNDFGWLKNVDFSGNFYTAVDIEKEINKLAKGRPDEKIKKYLLARRVHLANIEKVKAAFKKDKHVLGLVNTIQEAIYFRSWRTERFYRNAQYLDGVFKEIAKRIGCAHKDLFFFTPPEIISILQKSNLVNKKEFQARKKGYVLFVDGLKCYVESGEFLVTVKKKMDSLKQKDVKNDIIKGQTAYPGVVKGIARLVQDKKDFGQIKQGEILVTPSTTPDYVPVLKKVKAIITDEGGVLSHASVISREMKIPCIIGTKNATKIIKSGDMLEVDADKGIVKIIK